MEDFRPTSESERPNLYTDAGLDWVDRRERREWLNTLVFAWAISAAAGLLMVIVTGDASPLIVFATLALGATALLLSFARGQRRRSSLRRRLVREVVARAHELEPEDVEATLDRLHRQRRSVLLVGGIGGSIFIAMATPGLMLGTGEVAGMLVGGAVAIGIILWIAFNGLRNLDRDFAERRADTEVLLAEHRRSR